MVNKNNKKKPYLEDVTTLIQAGIDPKTGKPIRATPCNLKDGIKRILRVQDEQDAIESFRWYNLPQGLTGELIERVLYYKGQGCLFYMSTEDKFYFLPFALNGTIDIYGRYTGVTPLSFNGSIENGKPKEKAFIDGLVLKPIYDFPDVNSIDEFLEIMDRGCVIITDYSKQISQTVLPRQQLNEPLLDVESDCYPFARTALLNSTGVTGLRITSQDEYSNVLAASDSINIAALTGDKYIPIIGSLEFQDLTGGSVAKAEEFLLAFQSFENFRLGTHGIKNGGIFQKKAHELQSEADMNSVGGLGSTLQNRLSQRQQACDLINSVWNIGMSCEPSEFALGADLNMDGVMADRQDQSGIPGEQDPTMVEGGDADVQ